MLSSSIQATLIGRYDSDYGRSKKAGEDLMNGAKDAGKSIGKAAEETLDGLTGTPKNSSR